MSLKLIVNHLGNSATSLSMISGTVASGDINNLIAGPRSSYMRATAASGAVQPGYVLGADLACTHLVVARADLMVTLVGAQVRAMQRSAAAAWTAVSGTTISTLAAGNLIGPTSQDLVLDLASATQFRGFGVEFDSAGTEAMMISKLIGGIAFEFGADVSLGGVSAENIVDDDRFYVPMRGSFAYETERVITLVVEAVTRAKATAFKALPLLLRWPMYLYDVDGDIWSHKLEHVICLGWKEVVTKADQHSFQITFRRLKHYQ